MCTQTRKHINRETGIHVCILIYNFPVQRGLPLEVNLYISPHLHTFLTKMVHQSSMVHCLVLASEIATIENTSYQQYDPIMPNES